MAEDSDGNTGDLRNRGRCACTFARIFARRVVHIGVRSEHPSISKSGKRSEW